MTNGQGSQDPIRLELGATAAFKTCGSCIRFERTEPWNGMPGGYCGVILPSQYAQKKDDVDGRPWRVVRDTNTCDLYKSTGKTYIVSKLERP